MSTSINLLRDPIPSLVGARKEIKDNKDNKDNKDSRDYKDEE